MFHAYTCSPFVLGWHTASHFTKDFFIFSSVPPQRNFWHSFSTAVITLRGNKKTAPKKFCSEKMTELITCNQPAYDKCLVAVAFSFTVILWHNWLQSHLFHFWCDNGMPRYLIGRAQFPNPVMPSNEVFTLSETPATNMLDFSWLADRPAVSEKHLMASMILLTDCSLSLQKIIRSSAGNMS